jgi:glucose-1-phosphate thymidylyltransferase
MEGFSMKKGIILAGGLGTRLHPLTKVTNKSLLPMYDRPIIYWPIQMLVKSGIDDIMIVCGGNAAGEFLRVLGNGEQFGLTRLHYAYQSEPRGIADALLMAKDFTGEEPFTVILADNIFEHPVPEYVEEFKCPIDDHWRATIFTTEVENPSAYGVVETENGKVVSIVEKPENPKSNQIAVGLYMYTSQVWHYIHKIKPSKRGELEITDLNNLFLKDGILQAKKVKGRWADAGESIDGYLDCCNMAADFTKSEEVWELI